jgi:transcriptional regulator with XRE-family HTH domain|uniref:Helix-turn-helix domain protein n=1 Tax=Siphoviridae sp. ct43U4 TaxID=2826285 RepID=A0A8S5MZP3_9CAUD|nr:MAG TPA: helix-turn-helix domain protein [Siphoviridae sp. ct43U4]
MEDWKKTISDVRKEKSWTQTELARKMRVSTNSIRKWEKGYGEPSMNSRRKLKEVLNEDRDEEIMRFIHTLMDNIPWSKFNDERMHIWDMKTRKDCGTLKEYIGERMKALFGVTVEYGEEKKE